MNAIHMRRFRNIPPLQYLLGFEAAARLNSFSKAAEELGVPFLGAIPLLQVIAENGDYGAPIVYAQPESDGARAFRFAAEKLAAQVSIRNLTKEAAKPLGVPTT